MYSFTLSKNNVTKQEALKYYKTWLQTIIVESDSRAD